jgi:hypothetical protein
MILALEVGKGIPEGGKKQERKLCKILSQGRTKKILQSKIFKMAMKSIKTNLEST